MKKYCLLFFALLCFTITDAQNLALTGTATSSSNALQPAINAIDGNAGTRWESEFSDPQWITIDLGASYDIGQVVLNWEVAHGSTYEIQITDDPTFATYTTAFATTTGDGGIDDIAVNETGQYVRMYGTVRGTVYGYSLWEFEIYEALDPVTIATLSNLTVDGTTVPGFSSSSFTYQMQLAMGTTTVPTVVPTATQPTATLVQTDATTLPGNTTIVVTSENGLVVNTYTVFFTVEITPVNQTFLITFEPGTVGNYAPFWNVFENASNPPFEVVANPDPSGVNTSNTVGKLTTMAAGAPFAGCETQHGTIWQWVLDGTTTTISIDVYKTVISDVGIKMVNTTSGTIFQLLQPNTVVDEWQTLTYDITSAIASGDNHNVDQIVVFTDWQDPRPADHVSYFDNITWEGLKLADGIATGTPTGVTNFEVPTFEVFPNPSQDVWNIKSSTQVIHSVTVFDVLGKEVLSLQANADEVQIDASRLNPGLYFARVASDAGYKTVKLIKK